MTTAMQELIERLIDVAQENKNSKAILGVNAAINEASKYLEKEKQQIIDAYDEGFLTNRTAEDYYNDTYTQYTNKQKQS